MFEFERRLVGIRAGGRGHAANRVGAFRPKPQTRGVDRQWKACGAVAAIEDIDRAAARPHRQIDAGPFRYSRRPRPRRVDRDIAAQLVAAGEAHRRDTGAAGFETDRFVDHIAGAGLDGAPPQQLQQAVAVEPSFARQTERPEREPRRIEPGKTALQLVRRQQRNRRAAAALHGMLARQGIAAGFARQIQIARLDEPDLIAHGAQKGDAGPRQFDIEGGRELLADRARR